MLPLTNLIYASAHVASWRLLQFPMSDRYPSVTRLAVHEPGSQMVYLWDDADSGACLSSANAGNTTLTEFFRLNKDNASGFNKTSIRSLLYQETSKFFRMVGKKMVPRRSKTECVSRVDYCSPRDGERFYIRLLLLHVRGPTLFQALRTVDRVLYPTFREAADALGLLESDEHYNNCLCDASLWMTGRALRELFSIVLVYNSPSHPEKLWENHWLSLQDDCVYTLAQYGVDRTLSAPDLDNFAPDMISRSVERMGSTMEKCGIQSYNKESVEVLLGSIPGAIISHNVGVQDSQEFVYKHIPMFNDAQRYIFSAIRDQYNSGDQTLCYLDGPGGTGKTFLINSILHYFNSGNIGFISVASSGVAAQLLLNGTTAHSAFGIPLAVNSQSTCALSGRDASSKKLLSAHWIIWDEISMQHKDTIKCVERSLRHLRKNSAPFGGINVIFSGDFRQTLPIVLHQDYSAQAYVSIKSSFLWPLLDQYELVENVCLLNTTSVACIATSNFAAWLLDLGSGKLQVSDKDTVEVEHVAVNLVQGHITIDLKTINWLYNDLFTVIASENWNNIAQYFGSCCLITPLNKTVDEINQYLNEGLGGEFLESLSMDRHEAEDGEPLGEEYFNSVNLPGFSKHLLVLRRGLPMILIRNLNIANGLCNGTRLIVQDFSERVLMCRLISGSRIGETVMLPKIKLIHEPTASAPVCFSRFQFPVVDAFCLTINKAQGQTLDKVAVLLSSGVFAHGQLYVALSRCRSLSKIRVSISTNALTPQTTNVVLREVLKL